MSSREHLFQSISMENTNLTEENEITELDTPEERIRRWRLILGKDPQEQAEQQQAQAAAGEEEEPGEGGEGEPGEGDGDGDAGSGDGEGDPDGLSEADQNIDDALEGLYGDGNEGGSGNSSPDIARWLGDIRTYFPTPVAQMIQQDALKRLNLRKLLNDPDFLNEVEPDLNLVAQLVTLSKVMPSETRETAREVVRKVVEDLQEKLEYPLLQALTGSLNRTTRTKNPRKQKEINWLGTIHANLRHYQPKQRTVIPETLIGYGRQRSALHDVVLCIDQSGSMAKSVVYASIFGSVMASVPALDTRLILFDTSVADMTDELTDPVDLLFGLRLRGGTNIDKALAYCQKVIEHPRDTVLVLISDLFEGGKKESMVRRAAALVEDGVTVVVLLALNDDGAPRFDRKMAQRLMELGIPSFACTPDLFPELMAAAIDGQDLNRWAAANNIRPVSR